VIETGSAGPDTGRATAPGTGDAVDEDLVLARAYLSRVAEPACVPLWDFVRQVGPVDAVLDIRRRTAPDDVLRATEARHAWADPEADLAAAERRGIRLVAPESPDWPHFALASLERAGERRLIELRTPSSDTRLERDPDEPVPPLALWVRGGGDLAGLAVRSVGIVGARSATSYGERIADDFAAALAGRGFGVVSGGAYGIDAAAHRGALGASGSTYLVSAGGLDKAYPPSHTRLFEQCAASGLLISESPPGAAPQRRRFLSRNRLIAAFSTGSVVVEASSRSGAANTAKHCLRLDRPLMVVPGPVTSAMSAGCHALLQRHEGLVRLVTCVPDILEHIGSLSDLTLDRAGEANFADRRAGLVDGLDRTARAVLDSFPARGVVNVDDVVTVAALPVGDVLQALSVLEAGALVQRDGSGFRLRRPERARGT
jgi:DNA processing protein